jgi:hypothetical protein
MIIKDPVIRYVAVFRDGSDLGTLRQLLEHPLPPPHPREYIGCFRVEIPRWRIDAAQPID